MFADITIIIAIDKIDIRIFRTGDLKFTNRKGFAGIARYFRSTVGVFTNRSLDTFAL